jgi:hypothetical protein
LEKVKQDAEIFSSGSDDMSSDDEDFNPDLLEALSAKVCIKPISYSRIVVKIVS